MGNSMAKQPLEANPQESAECIVALPKHDLDGILQCWGQDGLDDTASAVQALAGAVDVWCTEFRCHCTPPFLVGWYNDERKRTAGGASTIAADDDAVAFAIYSFPGYIDVIAEHYARQRPSTGFVDATTNEVLQELRAKLPEQLGAVVVNTDEGPPYYHVQTVGAVAGVDQHMEAVDVNNAEWAEDLSDQLEETRDERMWGTDPEMRRKIFGVNMHPTYGGWYAYRALVVLHAVHAKDLKRPEPLNFVGDDDMRRILSEYNLKHSDCNWRDLKVHGHPPENKYTPEEFFFFTETAPSKRRKFLEMKAARNAMSRVGV